MEPKTSPLRSPLFLRPGEGRKYPMGRIEALFLADDAETDHRYSISQWWLEPHTKGLALTPTRPGRRRLFRHLRHHELIDRR